MQSLRTFDPGQLRHKVPPAPPPPPLPSPVDVPTLQLEQFSISNNSPPKTNIQYIEDVKPSYTNFVATGSPYLRIASDPSSNAVNLQKKSMKASVSLPTGEGNNLGPKSDTIPPPPPLPHLPLKRQPSALLRQIRGQTNKRRSGHNLGAYQGLRHVETVEKRAFRVGRVIGDPIHVVTTQDLIKSFNKRLLQHVALTEPARHYPVGRVVRTAPVHVPKMKERYSPKKKSSDVIAFSKKRAPGKLKKSPATAPEDELPRIPTPPPLDDIPVRVKSEQPRSKKSAVMKKSAFTKHKK